MQVELPGITLVGTAHVSRESVNEVREVVGRVRPAVVAVELDENRRRALEDKKKFQETPITELLKGGKGSFILAQTLLASYQRRMGAKEGVEPGAEMLEAMAVAKETGSALAMVDRDIGITLRRAYAKMGFREKMRLSWELMKSVVGADEGEEVQVDAMLKDDVLTAMMAELAQMAPTVADVLIHERDAYLAANIQEAAKQGHVVAVLGAGHLKGVEAYLRAPDTIPEKAPLEVVPTRKVPVGKIVGWALIASILAVFAVGIYLGVKGDKWQELVENLAYYVVITGGLSALGALLARGHVLSILTAFVAAPFTILHPTLAAGWFSGLVEARKRTPTVGDFHAVSGIQTLGEFWNNRVMRVLLVAAFTNLGAMAGALVAVPYLISRLAGSLL